MANEITTVEALQSLKPKAEWVLNGDVLTWMDAVQTEPTQAEIDAEVIRLQDIYDSQEYARNRKQEYDKLNQFEMQFDDQLNGTTTWVDTISAIKQEFPK